MQGNDPTGQKDGKIIVSRILQLLAISEGKRTNFRTKPGFEPRIF